MEPWVIEHRKGVIEVLEYFEEHPGWFQVYYQDEAAFRTHVTQKYGTQPVNIDGYEFVIVLIHLFHTQLGFGNRIRCSNLIHECVKAKALDSICSLC